MSQAGSDDERGAYDVIDLDEQLEQPIPVLQLPPRERPPSQAAVENAAADIEDSSDSDDLMVARRPAIVHQRERAPRAAKGHGARHGTYLRYELKRAMRQGNAAHAAVLQARLDAFLARPAEAPLDVGAGGPLRRGRRKQAARLPRRVPAVPAAPDPPAAPEDQGLAFGAAGPEPAMAAVPAAVFPYVGQDGPADAAADPELLPTADPLPIAEEIAALAPEDPVQVLQGAVAKVVSERKEHARENGALRDHILALQTDREERERRAVEDQEALAAAQRDAASAREESWRANDLAQTFKARLRAVSCSVCCPGDDPELPARTDEPVVIRCENDHGICTVCCAAMLACSVNSADAVPMACSIIGCNAGFADVELMKAGDAFHAYGMKMAEEKGRDAERRARAVEHGDEGSAASDITRLREAARLKAPCCGAIVPDFDGCCSLKCGGCPRYFCAWCFAVFNTSTQCHFHLLKCSVNMSGGYFCNERHKDHLTKIWRARQMSEIQKAYDVDLADPMLNPAN